MEEERNSQPKTTVDMAEEEKVVEVEKEETEAEKVEMTPPLTTPSRQFDPSRMIGIIKRKALIKDLAAAYHGECLAYCRELLELQKNVEEPEFDFMPPEEETRNKRAKPSKRSKKTR